jgi:beta-galactosidase
MMLSLLCLAAPPQVRTAVVLNDNWRRASAKDSNTVFYNVEKGTYDDSKWHIVDVPDNVNTYEDVQRIKHNDYHGDAWYRKQFICPIANNRRLFLFFEGVGSYATVWLNEQKVGEHVGGRTTFTLDVTEYIHQGKENLLVVKASQPAFIKDLPWVCGGCSDEVGFSEGSQPTGIFRPVSLLIANQINITPFGVHIWNDSSANAQSATLNMDTEIRSYQNSPQHIIVQQVLLDANDKQVFSVQQSVILPADSTITVHQSMYNLKHLTLWNLDQPYLYHVVTSIIQKDRIIDKVSNEYGIRTISWPNALHKQFLLNGKPVFINGTAEYEHLLGKSHAFTNEEIAARMMQVKAAGYKAFRDAHQPHNLYYQKLIEEDGLLWWPQFAAHIWYDNPSFRSNFKQLLIDWIRERRNNPAVILWGLENESILPEDFARECSEIIRSLDPTASSQRKITTCNGGTGTDWNVPQNWSGTYGGDTALYGNELKQEVLVGEYGAWRSIGLHAEKDTAKGMRLTENYMSSMLETKVRLAESVRNEVAGHFNWLLYSHENPGRVQSGEGMRDIDRIGPVNNKGLFTLWGEPGDAFYMYRSNYVDKHKEPMVYIVSHQWSDRWTEPGVKNNIIVYSNCDEVELFNDVNALSLGKRKRNGVGTHFGWNHVAIQYNVLYAVGYVNGKAVTKDIIVLHHLPKAPHWNALLTLKEHDIIQPKNNYHYVYRVNCGGNNYTDEFGNEWSADKHVSSTNSWGYTSWTDDYNNVPANFASQRNDYDPVTGTNAWQLFQSFRYGLSKLKYTFPVADGDYQVELYFSEPWYGVANTNCKGWRLFDVAINDSIVAKDIDLYAAAGYNHAIKKAFPVHVTDGRLVISFPNENAGEAVIMAIAIASKSKALKPAPSAAGIIQRVTYLIDGNKAPASIQYWMNTGDTVFANKSSMFSQLPAALYGGEWIKTVYDTPKNVHECSFDVTQKSDVYIAFQHDKDNEVDSSFSPANNFVSIDDTTFKLWKVYKRRFEKNSSVHISSHQPFLVAVTQADDMPSSYDLRSAVTYPITGALVKGNNISRVEQYKKEAITFNQNSADTVQFHIPVGVAAMYAIKLRYRTNHDEATTIKMIIQSAEGIIIKEETIQLPSYQKEKWGTYETNTGSYINAGKYSITFITEKAEGLSLSSIEIQ